MTRPRKQTVEWFPHSVEHGMTIFILKQRYGKDGYYFWFHLLEMLGKTEGHFIDYNLPARKTFLEAYTGTTPELCEEILSLLSDLDAIDKELWQSKIIWSENFVKGVATVYQNRRVETPPRPDNYIQKTTPAPISTSSLPVDYTQETAEEGEEGKERKRNRKDIAPPGPVGPVGAAPASHPFFVCPYFVVDFDYRMKLAREYPALTDDLLLKELSKAEDWISDNAGKKKFRANGHLHNPKLFIKNWLDKVGGIRGPGSGRPKGLAAVERFMAKGEHGNG